MKTKISYKFSSALIIILLIAINANSELITFETISSGVTVRDQFQSIGIRIIGSSENSGLVSSEGTDGIKNFGNSSKQTVYMGANGQPTTIQFVDPENPTNIIGATTVSLRAGDGDSKSEKFIITFFGINGEQLKDSFEYTTVSQGISISQTMSTLGALIGSVKLERHSSSNSGAYFDDLNFTLVSPCETMDTDSDGVIDIWDMCQSTPLNSYVDKTGCHISGLYTEAQMNEMVQKILSWGDLNSDNKISLIEAIQALRITSGVTEPSVK